MTNERDGSRSEPPETTREYSMTSPPEQTREYGNPSLVNPRQRPKRSAWDALVDFARHVFRES
jgi:hypothetical protein